jgi:very-short-patch-repair endonuclease
MPRLEIILDAALDEHLICMPRLVDAFGALAVRGRRGIRRLRPLIEARGEGVFVDTSELERQFTALLRNAGITEPRHQILLGGEELVGLVDFLFPSVALVVEVDGRRGHSQVLDFERDRRRDQIAATQGLRVIRFTHRQITRRPWEVVDVMKRLLAAPTPEAERSACTR